MEKIKIRGLKKRFGRKIVLDGIDLDLNPGESLVVLGGSGSGKSVLLKCILGIIEPDAGSVKIDGEEVTRIGSAKRDSILRKFGMLFQGGALFDSLPVWENISFGLLMQKRVNRDQAKEIAEQRLTDVGLATSVSTLSPAELSGGMQKRVALARAIAAEPDIIFFDEPTTGLDPIMCNVINHLIIKCVRQVGAAAITITHDLHSARTIADKIAMLYQGKIIWQGSVQELDTTDNPYVRQFIDGSAEGPIQIETKGA